MGENDSSANSEITLNSQLANEIIKAFTSKKLVLEARRLAIASKLAAGTMTAENWKQEALALLESTKTGENA